MIFSFFFFFSTTFGYIRLYLVGTNEVNGDGNIGDVDQPKGLIKAESGEKVSGSIVAKRSITDAAAKDVEQCGC